MVACEVMGESGGELVPGARDSLACQLRRPGSPARAVGVATVAVPVQTCTVTTGGHQGVASDGSRKGWQRSCLGGSEECSELR
jgi:hypothetical protein